MGHWNRGRDAGGMSAGVRFDGPLHSPAEYIRQGLPLPCNVCSHDIRQHEYLYSLAGKDVYRCKMRACACGGKSEVRAFALSANPTDDDIAAAIAALSAGGGLPLSGL